MNLKLITETESKSGASMTAFHKDGRKTTEEIGKIVETAYECPCGKGKVALTQEKIPGYYDWWAKIECADCDKKYELTWGKGVVPGQSPMIKEKTR
ncbi:MAG: hypothetical protein FWE53_02545 [Firmicutes bacterium]|nr:hypothetical protein [Bacillota bacterium]